jgi:hypothetical protein
MKLRRLILVTGAPRTATTPVGNLLAQCQGAVSLYEPLGPTGLAAIREPFPMVGDGLGIEQDALEPLLRDLKNIRLGKLRPQTRDGGTASLRGKLVGSRTLHSVRLARLQPWSRTVIWKDALERDERATYRQLLDALGLSVTRGVQRTMGAPRRDASVGDMSHKAHDWNRSLASLNRYWQDVLSEEDLANVLAITEDLVPAIAGSVQTPQLVAVKN